MGIMNLLENKNQKGFINQTGVHSLVDEDARIGRKSKNKDFFGYNVEFVMITDERIITSVRTAHGAYISGTYAEKMLEQTREDGADLKEVYSDKVYFRKNIFVPPKIKIYLKLYLNLK